LPPPLFFFFRLCVFPSLSFALWLDFCKFFRSPLLSSNTPPNRTACGDAFSYSGIFFSNYTFLFFLGASIQFIPPFFPKAVPIVLRLTVVCAHLVQPHPHPRRGITLAPFLFSLPRGPIPYEGRKVFLLSLSMAFLLRGSTMVLTPIFLSPSDLSRIRLTPSNRGSPKNVRFLHSPRLCSFVVRLVPGGSLLQKVLASEKLAFRCEIGFFFFIPSGMIHF